MKCMQYEQMSSSQAGTILRVRRHWPAQLGQLTGVGASRWVQPSRDKGTYSLHCPNFCSISGVIVKVQNQLVLLRLPFLWAVKYMDCPWEWDEQGHRLSLKRAFILLNLSSNTELYRLILSAIILSKLFVKTACRHSYWIIFLNKYPVQF